MNLNFVGGRVAGAVTGGSWFAAVSTRSRGLCPPGLSPGTRCVHGVPGALPARLVSRHPLSPVRARGPEVLSAGPVSLLWGGGPRARMNSVTKRVVWCHPLDSC